MVIHSIQRNWDDSIDGVVYLATNIDEAISYAETTESVPESYLDKIVILEIDPSDLDPTRLKQDQNNQSETT